MGKGAGRRKRFLRGNSSWKSLRSESSNDVFQSVAPARRKKVVETRFRPRIGPSRCAGQVETGYALVRRLGAADKRDPPGLRRPPRSSRKFSHVAEGRLVANSHARASFRAYRQNRALYVTAAETRAAAGGRAPSLAAGCRELCLCKNVPPTLWQPSAGRPRARRRKPARASPGISGKSKNTR